MRYGIISDVHGNLEALVECLELMQFSKVDDIFVLGDVVGYGPNPNECISLLKDKTWVRGNHDYIIANIEYAYETSFNHYAAAAIRWTLQHVTQANRCLLNELPEFIKRDGYLLIHGSPAYWDDYILDVFDAYLGIKRMEDTQIAFVGHTHVPECWVWVDEGRKIDVSDVNRVKVTEDNFVLKIEPNAKYIINVGSVGQPRDENNKGCCVIYDTEAQTIEYLRFSYDYLKTAKRIEKAGLPRVLGERLAYGR